MKKIMLSILMIGILSSHGCTQSKNDKTVGTLCEDCELIFEGMPEKLSWHYTIAGPDEPGEPMIISGVIYEKDGKTPAPEVILYVYHTDSKGKYSPAPKQIGGRRHGHLRGWIKTDETGRYQFTTIRPASYPISRNPQHIHPIIKESDKNIYWIDEYLFDDDPLLGEEEKKHQQKRGGAGIIALKKNEKGVWVGQRNIILGLNVENY